MMLLDLALSTSAIKASIAKIILLHMLVVIETTGEPIRCSQLVIDTTLHRVENKRFPNTLEGVLSQKGQYQWWKRREKKLKKYRIQDHYRALMIILDYKKQPTKTLFFYNPSKSTSDPNKYRKRKFRCGNHVFK